MNEPSQFWPTMTPDEVNKAVAENRKLMKKMQQCWIRLGESIGAFNGKPYWLDKRANEQRRIHHDHQ